MDIAILVLISCAIMLLVAIFAVIIVKNKGKSNNTSEIVQKYNDMQKAEIADSIAALNKNMLDELSRNITSLNTTLTNTISQNNNNLTTTISTNNGELNKTLDSFRETQEKKFESLEKKLYDKLEKIQSEMTEALSNQKLDNLRNNNDIRQTMTDKLTAIEKEIANELEKIRKENQTKLDEMRKVVDNTMQDTLNKRLTESFEVISKQLLEVSKGLGEMTNLTSGVNNLNKIMSNVKTRGMWGEISLENLLEQILTVEQYEKQLLLKGREMVDFAVVLPGKKEDEKVYLPIDAKFPLSDYQLLIDASESFDKEQVDIARKNLFKRIKEEAKSISSKYIIEPKTTSFAIMYLPIEGLFAEVARDTTLLDELQNKYKVVVSGPTTITALLNSLQLGFRTLQIQKNSKKVWEALAKFRTEFYKFADDLQKVKKQANTVVTSIEATSKRTDSIERVLNKLDKIDYDPENKGFLEGEYNAGEKTDD